MREELLAPVAQPVEAAEEAGLRPRRLAEFVGQQALKDKLEILLEAARQRGQAADHVLLAGPPGLGKTSLAGIVANELGVGFRVTSGPALSRPGDLAVVSGRRGRARVQRVLGTAKRIENVLEALLVETGARQRFEPHEHF